MSTMSPARHGAFVGLLFVAMGAATLAPAALGILASPILADLEVSRSTLGWIASTNVLLAGALSPFAGTLTDRLGGRTAIVFVFMMSAAAFAIFGIATAIAVMFVGSAIAALSQAGGNPSTNTLIGDVLPRGERGAVTGIKQSGVQASIAAAGLLLPSLAITIGWRPAMLVVAAVPLLAGIAALAVVPPTPSHVSARGKPTRPVPRSIWWLAGYGCVFGFAGAVTFFLPLYAEESLGLDLRVAGIAAALVGAVAFVARIVWARRAEQRNDYSSPLRTMAVLAIAAAAAFLVAPLTTVFLWVAVLLTGVNTSAWNSVGMLAVIDDEDAATGRASGIVLLGFLTGLGVGPPIYGAMVDATGTYTAVWITSLVASAASFAIVSAGRRSIDARSRLG